MAGNRKSLLKRGVRGPDVVRVQRAMNAAGTHRLKVTGRYNRATARAVGIYQRRVGVSATKIVGWYTWNALRSRTPVGRAQAFCSAASALVKNPSPSVPGPVRSSTACSGCGISPTTLPASLVTPAIARWEPLGLST